MAQGVGVTIGAESGILARWLLVAGFGRTAPLAFLKNVTLYLVMGDGGSLHERSDWGDQVDGVMHNLDQLFGVGALAHRGLPPFIGGLCGDHSPHRTTMTQTKRCPIFQFGSWWARAPKTVAVSARHSCAAGHREE